MCPGSDRRGPPRARVHPPGRSGLPDGAIPSRPSWTRSRGWSRASWIRRESLAARRCAPWRRRLSAGRRTGRCSPLRFGRRAGSRCEILTAEEEARLAFLGAARAFGPVRHGPLGVVDVGGGSSELVIGQAPDRVAWSASFPLGSGDLAAEPSALGSAHGGRGRGGTQRGRLRRSGDRGPAAGGGGRGRRKRGIAVTPGGANSRCRRVRRGAG